MVNSAIQALLNLTDTWFIGRLSVNATAAMSSIYWLLICAILLFGGLAMAVQTLVAQAFGSHRYARASQAAWSGLYASLLTIPLFALYGLIGRPLLEATGVPADLSALAMSYWWPRLAIGGPLGLFVWSLTGFFNGIGRARLTLAVTGVMALTNALFNQYFIFGLGLGMAGSAWGTVAAEVVGLLFAFVLFFAPEFRLRYRSQLTWRRPQLWRQIALGAPMGLAGTADLLGVAIFQLMIVRVGTVAGAATQIVMMLTSVSYMPGVGIALAGTTLVGQSIGAGNRDWAARVGKGVIALATVFMGGIGLALALAGPWLAPLFVNAADPHASEVMAMCAPLLWIAAGYQLFDGLNLGAGFCLRGAGDVRVPALLVAVLVWFIWLPLAHALTFAPGTGIVGFLPQYGYGAIGGWIAVLLYVTALGLMLYLRWHSGAWRRMRV
jgi:multidrug resistance protein, MATE family